MVIDDEDEMQIRREALHCAPTLLSEYIDDPNRVVDAAEKFAAFLRGESSESNEQAT